MKGSIEMCVSSDQERQQAKADFLATLKCAADNTVSIGSNRTCNISCAVSDPSLSHPCTAMVQVHSKSSLPPAAEVGQTVSNYSPGLR